jgi:hypothetical protein
VVDDLHHDVVQAEDPAGDDATDRGDADDGDDRDRETDADGGGDALRRGTLTQLREERVTHLASQPVADASHSGRLAGEEHLAEVGLVARLLQAEQGVGGDGEVAEEEQGDEPARRRRRGCRSRQAT